MLSYRTLFSIQPESGTRIVDAVIRETFKWLEGKGLDSSAVKANQETEVAENATVKWIIPNTEELAGTQRLILMENSSAGNWTSTLTIREPADGTPWFWMDVEGPEWAGAPRLVRTLIDEYHCLDRGVRLTKEPAVVYPQQVDSLIELLGRPGRRTLSFIAGSSTELPLQQWKGFVGKILRQSVGQASGYVLDPAATALFNVRIGRAFGVQPGMVRTYLPELDLENQQDAARHRFVTANSIASQDFRRLGETLSYKAREVAQESLVDENVRRIDRRLDDFEIRIPLMTLGPAAPEQRASTHHNHPVIPEKATEATVNTGLPNADVILGKEADVYLALRALVEEFSGGPATLTAVQKIRGQLEGGRSAAALSTRLLSTIDQKAAALDAATVEQARLRHLIDDLELDAGETWEQLEVQYSRTRAAQEAELALRGLLAKMATDVDWSALDLAATPELVVPDNFNTLVEAFGQLPYVTYTGNKDITAGLDEHDAVGRWCMMTWSILMALNDYGRLKSQGEDLSGVQAYLESPPSGARTYPPGKHARDESESVKRNPSYRTPRILTVPRDIDPSCEAFMGAHFRIAKHGLVSPRLHYLDATAAADMIVVGYIGPHLPNTQTN